jgi:hypothetical protein
MSFSALVRGSSLRAESSTFDAARFGRGFGTWLRRKTSAPRARVVVARADDEATLTVRDGLVQGLLLCGHDVKDVGAVASDGCTFALRHLAAAAGIVVTPAGEGAVSLIVFFQGRPLVGDGLQSLAALADGEDFSAGEGSLDIVDIDAAFRSAPKDLESSEGNP